MKHIKRNLTAFWIVLGAWIVCLFAGVRRVFWAERRDGLCAALPLPLQAHNTPTTFVFDPKQTQDAAPMPNITSHPAAAAALAAAAVITATAPSRD
jgi:hypothetical protein